MCYKYLLQLALLVVALLTFACEGKKTETTEDADKTELTSEKTEWKQMDDFHMVMAETFHPYKDSSNLAPAKAQARELFAAADKWSNSALPSNVDNDDMKTSLQQLKSETEAFEDVVKTGTDDAIGAQLTKVHDAFHKIQETWYGGGHEHEHKH